MCTVHVWYVLLIFHVAMINFPFWIYAPDYDVAPPPKRLRWHTGEVMASELSSIKSYELDISISFDYDHGEGL